MDNQTIENKIFDSIRKCGRGKLIFSLDFVRFGEQKKVNRVLERMAKMTPYSASVTASTAIPKSTRI